MNDRPSFSINKIVNSYVGSTGITGTSKSSVEPSSIVEYNEIDGFNASKTLFDNIDLLGKKLGINKSDIIVEDNNSQFNNGQKIDNKDILEVDPWMDEDQYYDGMSEEDAAKAYMEKECNVFPVTKKDQKISKFEYNFCTNCGNMFKNEHKFCGKCGLNRQ
jgi:ribosomal protein S27AE